MTPITFFAASDLVVIGTNPEMADFDNRRGEIYGEAGHVVAEDAQGNRCRLYVKTDRSRAVVLAAAEKQAAALNARLALGKLPVGFAHWVADRPAYGSDAYCAEDEIALERREAEEEAWG